MFTIPTLNYKSRLLIAAMGIIILFWSGLEDNQVIGVVFLGWIVAVLALIIFIMSRYGGEAVRLSTLVKLSPLVGAVTGASASLSTVLLMLFKDIRHAHVFPDYPPRLMLATLERLPVWAIGGGCILFGIMMLFRFIHGIRYDNSDDQMDK